MINHIKSLAHKIRNKYYTITYQGENVICEMCDWKGRFFFNGRCPKCNSLPRTRLIPFSIKYFNLEEEMGNILHVAPNLSEYRYVSRNVKFSIYDRLDIVKRDIINLQQDLTKMKIEDEQYNLSILWHVLEHIPNDLEAISELYRVMKKGGKVLVSVPIFPVGNKETYEDKNLPRAKYLEVHGHEDHCRSCGLDYFKRFESVGFKTYILNGSELSTEAIRKFGLSTSHVVWLFEK